MKKKIEIQNVENSDCSKGQIMISFTRPFQRTSWRVPRFIRTCGGRTYYTTLSHYNITSIHDHEHLKHILSHLSVYQIFDPESTIHLLDIRSWITCLPTRYSILNHLPAYPIFDLESPTCLPDIRSWIIYSSTRYLILNYLHVNDEIDDW